MVTWALETVSAVQLLAWLNLVALGVVELFFPAVALVARSHVWTPFIIISNKSSSLPFFAHFI